MKKKTILIIIFVIISFIFFTSLKFECFDEVKTCYKTECTILGCGEIEVDLDSPQCEIKKNKCNSGMITSNFIK